MDTILEVLLAKHDMDGSKHSAMGVLPHPFHAPLDLQQLWDAMVGLSPSSSNRFTAGAQGL